MNPADTEVPNGPTTPPRGRPRTSATRRLAQGLAWVGIGIGLAELLATRSVARQVGLQGREPLVRACGWRELASGVGILASPGPRTQALFVGSRVVGDVVDLAGLGVAALRPSPRDAHPVLALLAVGGVALLDLVCARTLAHEAHATRQRTDYSDRSGIPGSPDALRGAALQTFTQSADMRVSPPYLQSDLLH